MMRYDIAVVVLAYVVIVGGVVTRWRSDEYDRWL
jgi:hypothetical protein